MFILKNLFHFAWEFTLYTCPALHLFIFLNCLCRGNIKGSDVSSGEVLCDYLQPFPPRGIGYQRMVFVLYKQHGRIDFSKYRREQPW